MASLALYLKWRPRRFDDVVGQEHVTHTLKNAIRGERIAHAYLFTGPRGTGKTTMARLLAKAVNCLDPDLGNRPCNECLICQEINEGRLLELIEIDAASYTGVDNIRDIISKAPLGVRGDVRYKVYVIDEVHMLSTSAFNALLKTLEEPPEHVIFVLATTEPHRLLPTIVSRCQRFDFRRIPLSALASRLRFIADEEGIQIADSALRFIAQTSTGSARDAISLLDQLAAYGDDEITIDRLRSVLGYSDSEIVHQLVSHMCAHEIGPGLGIIEQAVGQGAEMRQFAQQVVDYVRSVLLLRVSGSQSTDVSLEDADERTQGRIRELAGQVSVHDLLRAIKLFNQAQLDLRSSDQSQLALELAFVEAALSEAEPATVQVVNEEKSDVAMALPTASSPPPLQRAPKGARTRKTEGKSPPRAAPPKSSSMGPDSETTTGQDVTEVKPEPVSIAPEYIERMRTEISSHLRAAGPLGRTADGFFGSVFAIGEIKVVGGDHVLLGLPQNVLNKVTDGINQLVQDAICSVLGKACQAHFADKAALSRYEGNSSATKRADSDETPVADPAAPEAAFSGRQGAQAIGGDNKRVTLDPYQQAVSDPVVQDLISRGGQVTGVQVLSEDE